MDTELSHTPQALRDSQAMEPAHRAVDALAEYAAALADGRQADAIRDEARTALSRYVEQLRRERVAPERALVMVKIVAQSLGSGMGIRAREDLVDEAVRWFIDAYYRTQPPAGEHSRETGA